MASAVCDAGPLIHLAEIGQLSLVGDFSPLWIPESVLREARTVVSTGRLELVKTAVAASDRKKLARKTRSRLHPGELDCLVICRQQPGAIFLTDDLDARETAERMRIETHGSVGIIVRGFRARRLDLKEAEQALRLLGTTSSLFVTREIIEMAIEQLRKSK